MYNKSTIVALDKLLSTSSVMRQHLIKGFDLVRRALTLLEPNQNPFNPVKNDWFVKNGVFYPCKGLKRLPEDVIGVCGCNEKLCFLVILNNITPIK